MQEHFHFTTDQAKIQKQYAAIFFFVSAIEMSLCYWKIGSDQISNVLYENVKKVGDLFNLVLLDNWASDLL